MYDGITAQLKRMDIIENKKYTIATWEINGIYIWTFKVLYWGD